MSFLARFLKMFQGSIQRDKGAGTELGYQLWLEDLGNQPEAVIDFLIDDMFIAGLMEKPDDMPQLPWEIIELPAGSDTYSLIHIKASELERLGAIVSVRGI